MTRNSYILRAIVTILVWLVFFSTPDTEAIANTKSEELQRKIADIGLLAQQLDDRKRQAQALLNALTEKQNGLAAEIRLLQKSLAFKAYDQVEKYDRARYNIELLRNYIAYSNEITKKINIYQTGKDKLTYLRTLAQDDIKMIRTLNDFQIDALTTQISLVINKYLSEAHIIQIDPKEIKLSPPEEIWKGIVKGKY